MAKKRGPAKKVVKPVVEKTNVFQYEINENTVKEIRNPAAYRMALELASTLNTLMKDDIEYRKYKQKKKVSMIKVIEYLLKLAGEVPQDESDADLAGVEGYTIKRECRQDVNEMIVACRSNGEILEMLQTKHKEKYAPQALSQYIKRFKNSSEGIRARKEWSESLGELRLFNKRGRLGELENLYIDAYRAYKGKQTRVNADMCLKILEQARREAMPIMNQVTVNNNSLTQNIFTNILAKEEEALLFERLPLHEIIIGKVAAKYDRDPYLLQRRLQNSYYASTAGAKGIDRLGDEIEYPTAILYNIADLGQKWKAIQKEEAETVKAANVEEVLLEDPSDIKQALLRRVAERKKQGEKKEEDDEK